MINLIFLFFIQKAYALSCGQGFIAVSLTECAPDPNFVPASPLMQFFGTINILTGIFGLIGVIIGVIILILIIVIPVALLVRWRRKRNG